MTNPADTNTSSDVVDANDWNSIRQWRKAQRERLIHARLGIGGKQRKYCTPLIQSLVAQELANYPPGCVGFYWPIKGEFDFRAVVVDAIGNGWQAALPVVIKAGQALEFRLWDPAMKLVPGVWNIPVPEHSAVVEPSVLIVPLVGYDANNFRLGYGGGYYDRTIASYARRPSTIGVGLSLSRLDSIYPQWHDIPMDKIITVETSE